MLSADRDTVMKAGDLRAYPVKANVKIYKGALLMIDSDGYLTLAASDATAVFAGVAYEAKDNTGGANGDVSCRVLQDSKQHQLPGAGFTQADVGKLVYATDDEIVALTQAVGDEVAVGKIDEFISATKVGVILTAKSQTK